MFLISCKQEHKDFSLVNKVLLNEVGYTIKSQTLAAKVLNDNTIGSYSYGDSCVNLIDIQTGSLIRELNFNHINWNIVYDKLKSNGKELYFDSYAEQNKYNMDEGRRTIEILSFFNKSDSILLSGTMFLRLKGTRLYNYGGQQLTLPKMQVLQFVTNLNDKKNTINFILTDTLLSPSGVSFNDAFSYENTLFSGNKYSDKKNIKRTVGLIKGKDGNYSTIDINAPVMNEYDKARSAYNSFKFLESNGLAFYNDGRNIINLETMKVHFTLDSTSYKATDPMRQFILNKNIITFFITSRDSSQEGKIKVKKFLMQYDCNNYKELYKKEFGDSISIEKMDFFNNKMYVLQQEGDEKYYLKTYSLPNH